MSAMLKLTLKRSFWRTVVGTCPAMFGFDKTDRASVMIVKHTQATVENMGVGIKRGQVCIEYKSGVYLKWTTQIIEFSAIFYIHLLVDGKYTQPTWRLAFPDMFTMSQWQFPALFTLSIAVVQNNYIPLIPAYFVSMFSYPRNPYWWLWPLHMYICRCIYIYQSIASLLMGEIVVNAHNCILGPISIVP